MSALKVGVIGIGASVARRLRLLWTDFPTLQIYDVADQSRDFCRRYAA